MKRDPEKDEALFALLAAAEDPHAAFAASALAEDPEARARFEDIIGMAAQLDALGSDERASLVRAFESKVESGAAESALRGAVTGGSRGILRGPWRGILIAAAVLALCGLPFLVGRGGGDGAGLAEGTLMGVENGLLPRGSVPAVESFRWPERAGAGGYWKVFVYDRQTRVELLASPRLEHTEWRPDPQQLATLNEGPRPRSFTWKVSFHDDSGGEPFDEWQEFELP